MYMGTNKPVDIVLYNQIKERVKKEIPTHSAYRSGIIVQKYKKQFTEKYGARKKPYTGTRTRKKGLKRWFMEKWVNQRGNVGYKHKHDIYRPSIRITKKTPITHGELSSKEINNARKKKYRTGRVNRFRKTGGTRRQTKKMYKSGSLYFHDHPEFRPNLTPQQMFEFGSFGGTYWRPIYSSVNKKHYKNVHKKYTDWWKNVPEENLSSSHYDIKKNKYKVKVGTTLEFWESKKWIRSQNPYGWVHWYCDFFSGKRSDDDERQIARWRALAGQRGRFMRFLVSQIIKKNATWNDETISPKIRQVLQHWGYRLTKRDFNHELKRRKSV